MNLRKPTGSGPPGPEEEALLMEAKMDIVPVKSRDLALIGYDSTTSTLEVVFRAGGVYRYQGVPENVYHGLMAAPSHGIFFQKYIKVQYPFVKVS